MVFEVVKIQEIEFIEVFFFVKSIKNTKSLVFFLTYTYQEADTQSCAIRPMLAAYNYCYSSKLFYIECMRRAWRPPIGHNSSTTSDTFCPYCVVYKLLNLK